VFFITSVLLPGDDAPICAFLGDHYVRPGLDWLRRTATYLLFLDCTTMASFPHGVVGLPPVINLYSSATSLPWRPVLGLILAASGRIPLACGRVNDGGCASCGHYSRGKRHARNAPRGARHEFSGWLRMSSIVTLVTLDRCARFPRHHLVCAVFSPPPLRRTQRSLARMVYGIICFPRSLLRRTVLGHLADKAGAVSGLGPEGNGAIIIVLWNRSCCTARWGIVREVGC